MRDLRVEVLLMCCLCVANVLLMCLGKNAGESSCQLNTRGVNAQETTKGVPNIGGGRVGHARRLARGVNLHTQEYVRINM